MENSWLVDLNAREPKAGWLGLGTHSVKDNKLCVSCRNNKGGEKAKTTVLWAPNIKIIFQMNHFGLSQNGEDKTWGLILSQMSLVLSLEGGKMELISILNINNVAKSKILSGR